MMNHLSCSLYLLIDPVSRCYFSSVETPTFFRVTSAVGVS